MNLLPTYKGGRSVRLRIGKVIPEIKLKWMVATIPSTTEDKLEIITVSKSNSLNWWEYGTELWLCASREDIEYIPYQIEIPSENSVKIVVGRRKPNCYPCG